MTSIPIVFLNVPPRLRRTFAPTIRAALRRARELRVLPRPLTIALVYDPEFDTNPEIDVHAYPLKSRFGTTVMVRLNLWHFRQRSERTMSQIVAGVVFHEIVHVLRGTRLDQRSTTGDVIVEEGIAMFFQAYLLALPPLLYREPQMRELRTIARAFRHRLNRRHHMREDPLRRISTTDERIYRFGYAMVRAYVESRSSSTFQQLLETPRRTYLRFLRTWIRNLRHTAA